MAAIRSKTRRTRKTAQAAKSESTDRQFRGVMIRVNPEGLKALRLLAVERDARIQRLGIEALNDLLLKYGKRPVVQNPLLDKED
jgi:Antitoxin-like ribbon-helix-helix